MATKSKKQWGKLKGSLSGSLPLNAKKRSSRISNMLPNVITIAGLCAGLTALRFAWLDQLQFAVIALFVAGLFDAMDGRVARFLNATTRFGAELDSLSDCITFGVTPALIAFQVSLKNWGAFGWMFVLWFVICGMLRLARFNTLSIEGTTPTWAQGFFKGVPITMGAPLALTPLMLYLGGEEFACALSPFIMAPTMACIGFLMVSSLPTFSLKKINLSQKHFIPLSMGLVGLSASLISFPWITLSVIMIVYVFTLPFSYWKYKKLEEFHTQPSLLTHVPS